RLIVDAGQSFASGQVYVALSRCRTLEGIVLKSKITPEVIITDRRVPQFQDETQANDRLEEILNSEKYDYSIHKIVNRLDCRWILPALQSWHNTANSSKFIDRDKVKFLYESIKPEAENFNTIFRKFEKIMHQKTQSFISGKEDWKEVEAKAKGAVNFFFNQINAKAFSLLLDFSPKTAAAHVFIQYHVYFRALLDDLPDCLHGLMSIHLLDMLLFDKAYDFTVPSNVAEVPSHMVSYRPFENGKTIPEIS